MLVIHHVHQSRVIVQNVPTNHSSLKRNDSPTLHGGKISISAACISPSPANGLSARDVRQGVAKAKPRGEGGEGTGRTREARDERKGEATDINAIF